MSLIMMSGDIECNCVVSGGMSMVDGKFMIVNILSSMFVCVLEIFVVLMSSCGN